MTKEEKDILELLGKVMMDFTKLPVLHQSDHGDFVFHIHALQNIILSRVAIRQRAGIV